MTQSFLLLLDTSGSMYGQKGEKIFGLNQAVTNLLEGLKTSAPEGKLALITFGRKTVFTDFAPVSQITHTTYEAGGKSLFDEALSLADTVSASAPSSDEMITILISDGILRGNLSKIKTKIKLAGPAYAIAIGIDADYEQLAQFTESPSRVLPPHAAGDLAGYVLQRR